MKRHVGVNVPLFSLRSSLSWGIGELTDIVVFADWMADASFDRLMLLPLGTMPFGQTSPYSAVSTLAIDPIYIGLEHVPEFTRAGGVRALSTRARSAIAVACQSPTIRYDDVRQAKDEALHLAFARFVTDEWWPRTDRAAALAAYVERERWWIDDYALYLAIERALGGQIWCDWPAALREREPAALADARQRYRDDVLFFQYAQWVAETQWQAAREAAHARGIRLFGDLPFVAGTGSPEVWARADEFRLDVSTGVPPDAFSATGQDWGLPTYNWPVIAARGYVWQRQRASRMAALFDGLRVDHVIGLFRTYGRPRDGEPFFTPATEPEQIAQGRALMQILAGAGLQVIAEDLGVVPDFLRAALAELHIPGCKVMRWERDWHAPGAPFFAPESYVPLSAAMTGTHDTEPLAVWWETSSAEERTAFLRMLQAEAEEPALPAWSERLRDEMLGAAYRAGSSELFLPLQDVFGWTDRVNVPGTVGPHNWTWAVPTPVDEFRRQAQMRERAVFLRNLAQSSGRAS